MQTVILIKIMWLPMQDQEVTIQERQPSEEGRIQGGEVQEEGNENTSAETQVPRLISFISIQFILYFMPLNAVIKWHNP